MISEQKLSSTGVASVVLLRAWRVFILGVGGGGSTPIGFVCGVVSKKRKRALASSSIFYRRSETRSFSWGYLMLGALRWSFEDRWAAPSKLCLVLGVQREPRRFLSRSTRHVGNGAIHELAVVRKPLIDSHISLFVAIVFWIFLFSSSTTAMD